MENKIGYHICKDVGSEHVQIYEEVAFDNMGGAGITSNVVQTVTAYDHATDEVTSGEAIPEQESSAKADEMAAEETAEQPAAEVPPEEIEEPEEEPAEERAEEQEEEPAEEEPAEDVEEAEEQPADAEEVEE